MPIVKHPTMKQHLKYVPLAIIIASLATILVCLPLLESHYLWKVQELNLFMHTGEFFRQQMVVAGGCLSWIGTFFTEFFYYPWCGTALLVGWWALLIFLTACAFRIPLKALSLLLIPVVALLVSDVDLGYWIYYLKLKGYFFVGTIGTTMAVALVWVYRCITPKYFVRIAFIIVTAFVAYPLMGFYGLLAVLMMGIISWRLEDMNTTQKVISLLAALLTIIAVPLIFYRWVYYQTNIHDIYTTALPLFEYGKHCYGYDVPFIVLSVFFLILAATYRHRKWNDEVRKCWLWTVMQVALVAGLVGIVVLYWYRDQNFHKELAMQHCIEDDNWEGVLAEAASLDGEPTRSIIMLKNLALANLGRQGDEMYHYRGGSKIFNAPIPVQTTQVSGKLIYYHYGMLNFCYRWCLEDGVEMGWRAEFLKYLTRCALLNGEHQVAQKYINVLKKTTFHKEWAQQQEKFIGNMKLLREDKRNDFIFRLMGYDDSLNSDNSNIEQFLMHHLVNIISDDPVLQEQVVIAGLWMKDIQTFWPRFFKYAELMKGKHIPVHFQEAAYLYGNLEHQVDISHMPFDEAVPRTFQAFMAKAQQYGNLGEDWLRENLYNEFGHTFYYEYFLMRDQKLY